MSNGIVKYTAGGIGHLRVIGDFLPPRDALVPREHDPHILGRARNACLAREVKSIKWVDSHRADIPNGKFEQGSKNRDTHSS